MSNKLLFCQCYNEMSTKIFESETPWPQEYFQTNGIGGANITGHLEVYENL